MFSGGIYADGFCIIILLLLGKVNYYDQSGCIVIRKVSIK